MDKAVKSTDKIKDWVRVTKTAVIFDKCKNLNFEHINFKLTDFCNNNKVLPIRISVYCYANAGDHELYGRVITSVREIEMGGETLEIISKRDKTMGHLYVDYFKVDMKPSLLNYMKNGW